MSLISVILLAGGIGSRMNHPTPKQFLKLKDKEIALYSFDLLKTFEDVFEIIVVAEPDFRHLFQLKEKPLKFALPGKRRQDSVYNGFLNVSNETEFILIHDSARPFLNKEDVKNAIQEALIHGASTLAVPLKFTVKEKDENNFIKKTLDRSLLYEIQTPQIIRQDLLKEGFKVANEKEIEVTDDVSLVELINKPVKLVTGNYKNIKITTKEDLILANLFLNS